MIQLAQVTLIAVATRNIEGTVKAMEYSCRGIEFGKKVLVAPYCPENSIGIHWDKIEPFPSIDEWNEYIVYHLWKHFDTDYCLLVHNDGFVVHPESWTPDFLGYDYIGSPWGYETSLAIQGGRDQPFTRVGNSVGIRSRRLCKLPTDAQIPWRRFNADSNEDTFISAHCRKIFEGCGMRFAPFGLAMEFGREEDIPECQHVDKPFLFHKWSGRNANYPRF